MEAEAAPAPARPTVSVVMPFAGDAAAARAAVDNLARIATRPGDELIAVDNTAAGTLAALTDRPERVAVVAAPSVASSYHARNAGAASAGNDWLLFIDADCRPDPGILEAYFSEPPADDVGAIAGRVDGDPAQTSLTARYARRHAVLDQAATVGGELGRPHAVTANVLVRAAAWREVGGFAEGVRSGGDTDLSWRLQNAGWRLEHRAQASVQHRHRETLASFVRAMVRYSAGAAWLRRRHAKGFAPPYPPVQTALRALGGAVRRLLAGQRELAGFRVLDAVVAATDGLGRLLPNAARAPAITRGGDLVVLVDRFPVLSETFVVAEVRVLRARGAGVRVEALSRADVQDLEAARELPATFAEDDPPLRKARDVAWLVVRHPLRCAADLAARRRWAAQEPVIPLRMLAPLARRLARGGEPRLHAHFAMSAALCAMRLHRLLGVRFSLTAHAYDIYLRPANLAEKLATADVVTSGCDYTVRDLRRIAGPEHADKVHRIVMGVDGERFRRRTPHPEGRVVVGVGRLVEKKGFAYLVDAAALLAADQPLDELVLVGDGELREALRAQAERQGIGGTVRLVGAQPHEAIREILERADVLAMPCVVARDGDRDSMPVVVKEALAMEIPVVATDEVGLPEIVRQQWGRLVPPRDAAALAAALAELLALPVEQRAAMGVAGREFVLAHCNVERETARLAGLLGLPAGFV